MDAEFLRSLFKKHGGVAHRAADELGVSRRALYYRLKSLGVRAGALRKT